MGNTKESIAIRQKHGGLQPESECRFRGALNVIAICCIFLNCLINCCILHRWIKNSYSLNRAKYATAKTIKDSELEGLNSEENAINNKLDESEMYIEDYEVTRLRDMIQGTFKDKIIEFMNDHFSEEWI